jgi:Flp pilus assembly protein TadG
MPATPTRYQHHGRHRSEHGAAMLELALVAPMLMLLVLGAIQFALWYHAQSVVLAAAQDGARLAAAETGSATVGRQRAQALVRAGLGQAADSAIVNARRDPDTTLVEVTAELRPLLPIVRSLRLHATGRSLTERFRAPAGGGP